jgi:hypothetical protein
MRKIPNPPTTAILNLEAQIVLAKHALSLSPEKYVTLKFEDFETAIGALLKANPKIPIPDVVYARHLHVAIRACLDARAFDKLPLMTQVWKERGLMEDQAQTPYDVNSPKLYKLLYAAGAETNKELQEAVNFALRQGFFSDGLCKMIAQPEEGDLRALCGGIIQNYEKAKESGDLVLEHVPEFVVDSFDAMYTACRALAAIAWPEPGVYSSTAEDVRRVFFLGSDEVLEWNTLQLALQASKAFSTMMKEFTDYEKHTSQYAKQFQDTLSALKSCEAPRLMTEAVNKAIQFSNEVRGKLRPGAMKSIDDQFVAIAMESADELKSLDTTQLNRLVTLCLLFAESSKELGGLLDKARAQQKLLSQNSAESTLKMQDSSFRKGHAFAVHELGGQTRLASQSRILRAELSIFRTRELQAGCFTLCCLFLFRLVLCCRNVFCITNG